MKRKTIILLAAVVAAGCAGEFKGMPGAETLAFQTSGTYGSLHTLALAYGEAINNAIKADTLHPGMYADYGVTLALMGHKGPACRMLNSEMRAFPESRGMVRRIKQRLLPDMMGDTLCGIRDTVNMEQLAAWGYDSVAALQLLPHMAPVIDSTDTLWLSQQTPTDSLAREVRLTANQKREMLVQEQQAEAAAKQARTNSIAAAKQAKIEAREQAKKDRAAERERQKQEQAAERERQKQEQAAERERQKQEQAAERERQKQEQAAERERQKREQAAERERQKQEQAAERERQKQEREAARNQRNAEEGGDE